jgi:alkaline phosphatase D
MKVSRRQLGGGASAAGLLVACGSDDGGGAGAGAGGEGAGGGDVTLPSEPGPEPADAWQPTGTLDEVAFVAGVRVGDATASSAIVAVRTSEANVALRVAIGTDAGWELIDTIEPLTATDGLIAVELDGLLPDHVYAVVFFTADGARRSSVSRFRSALADDTTRFIRFGATSCLGGNYPWRTLTHAAWERFDFFLLLGDTIYADWGAGQYDFETKWIESNGVQGMRDLAASTSFVSTWDDHEVDNNWTYAGAGMEELASASLVAFRRGMPQRIGEGGTGIWRKLSWGVAVDLFVLDCRGKRRDGNYLSPEQMTWLKDALSASKARFKVILNSVPIIDFTGTLVGDFEKGDRWQGFPAQRTELLTHIVDEKITGVLFVSGDFHLGGVAYVDPIDGPSEGIFEVLAGPGGSPISPGANIPTDERLISLVGTHNYTLFEADPATGIMRVRFIDDYAMVVDELELQL